MVLLTVRGTIEEIRQTLSALNDKQHSEDLESLVEAVEELRQLVDARTSRADAVVQKPKTTDGNMHGPFPQSPYADSMIDESAIGDLNQKYEPIGDPGTYEIPRDP